MTTVFQLADIKLISRVYQKETKLAQLLESQAEQALQADGRDITFLSEDEKRYFLSSLAVQADIKG